MSTNVNTITKIIIEGFQSYKKTTVTPAAAGQLTVLTGPSDTGKTAIIRALRWVLYNIPQGTDYIRAGTNTARVTVEYSSGHQVVRERTRSYNRYIVIDPAGKREIYEGFGVNVPLEVQQVTGVRPVVIADLEIMVNLSEQLDGPFLGSKSVSAGARAKVLGKLAGTEEIDHATRQLGTDLYRRRQDEKGFNNIVVGLTEKISAYDYLEELGTRIDAANKALAVLKADIELLQCLEQLDAGIQEVCRLAQEKRQVVIELQASLGEIEPLLSKVVQDTANEGHLDKLSAGLTEARDGLTRAQGILDSTADVGTAIGLIVYTERDNGDLVHFARLTLELEANNLNWVQNLEVLETTRNYDIAGALINETEKVISDLDRLKYLSNSLFGARHRIGDANRILEHTKGQPEAERLLTQISQDALALSKLEILTAQITNISYARDMAQAGLQATAQVDELATLVQDTERQVALYLELGRKSDNLVGASFMAEELASQIVVYDNEVRRSQQKHIDLLIELGICPTCGADVIPEKLKEVV